jgi:cell division protein ZapB
MTSGQTYATETGVTGSHLEKRGKIRICRKRTLLKALTDHSVGPILSGTNKPGELDVLDEEIKKLEDRVSTLVGICKRLKEENGSLRVREKALTETNAKLSEKNRLARTRIESIIGKLKAMDAQGASHRGNGDGRG